MASLRELTKQPSNSPQPKWYIHKDTPSEEVYSTYSLAVSRSLELAQSSGVGLVVVDNRVYLKWIAFPDGSFYHNTSISEDNAWQNTI